ncbi:MAG: alpha-amylase family glycosyl hydrolase [Ignavibacteria bacterium]|nr:alpha-amylase family glycosyl hydrolase [Ignavibacteria bacterium]
MGETKTLIKLFDTIQNSNLYVKNYFIPSIWENFDSIYEIKKVEPKQFFLSSLEKILNNQNRKIGFSFPESPLTYCMLLRYTTTFDHNQDNKISLEPIEGVLFETGTFLKSISILPYLKNLGVDIIYLLPISEIGIYGRKGNLGSPYAYKNPLKIDPKLSEPFLNLTLEEQFKAFVEACHILGMKVVLEFVFRTASIDSDLAIEQPNWFYWVKENKVIDGTYKPPVFDKLELEQIFKKIENRDFSNLIEPKQEYKNLFTETPKKVFREDNRIIGILESGERVTIPSAFADWPPNDTQPLWTDVTYLKYYDHPDFNYIAYNTVRMYSKELQEEGQKIEPLWNYLTSIIPYYINNFDIDGAMIDMGHAIPEELLNEIIKRARKEKENFLFWEENFSVTEKSKKYGYNATLGYLFFDQNEPTKLIDIVSKLESKYYPLPFFLASENHNTPRSAKLSAKFNELVFAFNSFLPGIRFILSGFELCHTLPYNTGLCFSEDELNSFTPINLPLFSAVEFTWNSENIVDTIRQINTFLEDSKLIYESFDSYSINIIKTNNKSIVGYSRQSGNTEYIVFGNFSKNKQKFDFENSFETIRKSEILLGNFCLDHQNQLILEPYAFIVLKKQITQ